MWMLSSCGSLRRSPTTHPLNKKSQTSSWSVLHWRLESSVQIRVLGFSVPFLSNYHEVPLGFEVSLHSGYSNEMECTMVSWWSLRLFLEGNWLPKILLNQFWLLCSKTQCPSAAGAGPHRTAEGDTSATDSPSLVCVNHGTIFHMTTGSFHPPFLSPSVRPSLSSHSHCLALVSPCLDITSPERNVNRIRPIPAHLPLNSSFSPPLLCCRATWSFPCTRHNLRFRFWRLTVRLRRSAVSGVGCSMWSRSPA